MGIEGVVLEDHGDITILRSDIVHEGSIDIQLAVGNILKSRNHAKGGGLAASGRTDQNDELLVLDVQVDIMNSRYLVVVDLLQTFQQHFRHNTRP